MVNLTEINYGWDNFLKKHAMGWVIIELSKDKKEFYNDSFWTLT